jgi:release factor glutamine methyltransferase
MQISDNTLNSLHTFYQNQLKDVYDINEIKSIFITACEHFLNKDRQEFQNNFNIKINQSELINIYNLIPELKKCTPIQYLLNNTIFYNLNFYVNNCVLIPRPETEELVDFIIKENNSNKTILDIGTGSGCIILSLKKNINKAKCSAIDVSSEALSIAKLNAKNLNLEVEFIEANILTATKFSTVYDLIVSNPPYIKQTEKESIHKNVLNNEPHVALFVYEIDEIIFYKKIIDLCGLNLKSNGLLYFELNPLTANDVLNYAIKSNLFKTTELIKDMSGKFRFFRALKY